MDALYHQTNRLLQEVAGEDLGRLERQPPHADDTLEHLLQEKLDTVNSNCSRLDMLVNKEPPQRRSNAKYRVDQLKYDYKHILNSMRMIQERRQQRKKQEDDRSALLMRSFTTNDTAPRDTTISLDHTLHHHDKLQSANRSVDEMLGAGSSVLDGLRHQGSVLKGAHRRVLDLTSTLGMSNTVMRLVERRGQQDKFILVGGMVVVLVLLYIILRYF